MHLQAGWICSTGSCLKHGLLCPLRSQSPCQQRECACGDFDRLTCFGPPCRVPGSAAGAGAPAPWRHHRAGASSPLLQGESKKSFNYPYLLTRQAVRCGVVLQAGDGRVRQSGRLASASPFVFRRGVRSRSRGRARCARSGWASPARRLPCTSRHTTGGLPGCSLQTFATVLHDARAA